MGVIEAITWESLLRGGVEIGEQIELTSPSMGEGWNIIVKKISHRFSTRDRQAWSTSWEESLHEAGKSGYCNHRAGA